GRRDPSRPPPAASRAAARVPLRAPLIPDWGTLDRWSSSSPAASDGLERRGHGSEPSGPGIAGQVGKAGEVPVRLELLEERRAAVARGVRQDAAAPPRERP